MEPEGLAELLSSTDTAALSAELDSAQFVVARLEERCAALQAELGRTEAEVHTLCATSPSPPHQNTDTNHQPPATKHHQTPPNTNPRDAAAFLARRAPLPSTPPPTSPPSLAQLASLSARGAGAGGAAIERSYERELRREAAARRDRLASARALLSRAKERRTKLSARLQQLRSKAAGGGGASDSDGASSPAASGGSGGSGGAYRSAGRRASDRGGSSARGRAAEREASRRGSVEDELDALKRRMGRK